MKKIVFIAFAITVIIAGLSIYLVKQKKTSQTVTQTLPQVGITIDVPKDWQKEESSESASFYTPIDKKQEEGHILTGCKVTLTTSKNTEGLTPDSLIQKMEKELEEDIVTVLSKQASKIKIADKEAVDWSIETAEMGYTRTLYIFSGDQLKVAIFYAGKESNQSCQSQFDKIVKTINL